MLQASSASVADADWPRRLYSNADAFAIRRKMREMRLATPAVMLFTGSGLGTFARLQLELHARHRLRDAAARRRLSHCQPSLSRARAQHFF